MCRAIVPGRAFLRRLYLTNGRLKPHHHVKITAENRLDLIVWKEILLRPHAFYKPFMECIAYNAQQIDMFSDASGNYKLGFGAYCGTEWTYGQWDLEFCQQVKPSIEYLELFAVLVGVLNWGWLFSNKRIILFCDNISVVHMINNLSSNCKNCMILIKILTAESICRNVRIFCKHVGTKQNGKADALSRLDLDRFWRLSQGHMNEQKSVIPSSLWPMQKI